ncbi:hypothetical protein [Amphritea sp. HPY]|uniref:hypothetical protein n=1 Tax=Amphritea sp. HPY TaxID=3421652 RepID=UPI003D7EA994
MKISTKYGFAFLCNPKCASTSIENAIDDICNIKFAGHPKIKHMNARGFETYLENFHLKIYPKIEIESFCIFRDPYQWIESWYKYRARAELKSTSHPNHKNYTGDITYNEFIEAYTSNGKRPPFAILPTQFDFIKSSSDEIYVDNIFTVDNLSAVSDFLEVKTGKKIIIPQKNISPKQKVEELEYKTRTKLESHLEKDITLYNHIKETGRYKKSRDQSIIPKIKNA